MEEGCGERRKTEIFQVHRQDHRRERDKLGIHKAGDDVDRRYSNIPDAGPARPRRRCKDEQALH